MTDKQPLCRVRNGFLWLYSGYFDPDMDNCDENRCRIILGWRSDVETAAIIGCILVLMAWLYGFSALLFRKPTRA